MILPMDQPVRAKWAHGNSESWSFEKEKSKSNHRSKGSEYLFWLRIDFCNFKSREQVNISIFLNCPSEREHRQHNHLAVLMENWLGLFVQSPGRSLPPELLVLPLESLIPRLPVGPVWHLRCICTSLLCLIAVGSYFEYLRAYNCKKWSLRRLHFVFRVTLSPTTKTSAEMKQRFFCPQIYCRAVQISTKNLSPRSNSI